MALCAVSGFKSAECRDQFAVVLESLALFFTDRRAARRAYARFVTKGAGQAPPEATQQLYMGDDDFVARMAKRVVTTSSEVPRRRRIRKTVAQYAREAPSRDAAIEAVYASGGAYTLKAIGEHFGLHYATVSRIARRAML